MIVIIFFLFKLKVPQEYINQKDIDFFIDTVLENLENIKDNKNIIKYYEFDYSQDKENSFIFPCLNILILKFV